MDDLEKARAELRGFLQDIDALKNHVDLQNPAAKPFADAHAVALKKALVAAAAYAVIVGK